jgi:hypothetical protein
MLGDFTRNYQHGLRMAMWASSSLVKTSWVLASVVTVAWRAISQPLYDNNLKWTSKRWIQISCSPSLPYSSSFKEPTTNDQHGPYKMRKWDDHIAPSLNWQTHSMILVCKSPLQRFPQDESSGSSNKAPRPFSYRSHLFEASSPKCGRWKPPPCMTRRCTHSVSPSHSNTTVEVFSIIPSLEMDKCPPKYLFARDR